MKRLGARWWLAGLALFAVVGYWRWHAPAPAVTGMLVAGGDGGGLPRASPEEEGFAGSALQAAANNAFAQGTSALLLMRHGHLVFERYADGAGAGTAVEGGEMSRALLVVAAGIAVAQHGMIMPARPFDAASLAAAIAAASGSTYPAFLSRHVWQPLHAAPGYWAATGMRARCLDWLRVADLLLHDGRFEGTQVVAPGWVAPHFTVLFVPVGLPGSSEWLSLRGPDSLHVWLAPRLDAVLLWVAGAAPAGAVAEQTTARAIVSTLHDRAVSGGASLSDLVPGH